MPEHWANQYRDARASSLEWWIYLAACSCRGPEERIRAIGQYAFDHENVGIWHAAWELGGKTHDCYCSPCCHARGLEPMGL